MEGGKIVGVGLTTSLFGLGLIITSSLVLYDAIEYKNRQWERQYTAYHPNKYGPESYWDSLKSDDDMLVILTPLTLLVGLVQLFLPLLFCCQQSKDLKRTIQLWVGTSSVLIFMALSCFILGMVYKIDTLGYKAYQYDGRQSRTYYSSWWKYEKGQAYLGVLGCDVIVLLAIFIWMIRWIINERHSPPSAGYEYQYGNVTPV